MDVPSPPPAAAPAFAAAPAPAPWSAASTGPPHGAGIRAVDGADFAVLLATDAPGNGLPPDGNLLPLVAPWAPLVTSVTPGPSPAASTGTPATEGIAGRAVPLPVGPYPALPPAAAAPSPAGGWSTLIGPAGPAAPPDSVPFVPAAAAVPPPPVRAEPPPAPGVTGAPPVPWPLPAAAAGTDVKLAARTPPATAPAAPPAAPPVAGAPAPSAPQAAGGPSGPYPAPSPDPSVFTASSPPAAAVSTGSSADPAAALAGAAADPGSAPAPVAAGGIAAAPAREAPPAVAMQIAEPPGSEAWSRALGERVIVMADRDLTQARIALNPPQLGPLEIRVHVSGDQASVTFTAHSQLTRDAIEQALPRLRDMLGGQGFTQVDVNISQHSFSERSPAASAWAWAPSDGLAELPDVAAEPSRRAPGGARLDLYA